MSLSEIFSDAIKYPISDITNFAIVGVIAVLAGISSIGNAFTDSSVASLLLSIIGLIFALVLGGYAVDVIKKGIENSSEFPNLDLKRNIINGIKSLIIGIVYFIIPFIIVALLAVITGVGLGVDHILASFGIVTIIAIIVFFIFAIFEMIALARFADTDDLGAALSFGEVFEDVKRIGIGKIIGFLVIAFVIAVIVYIIAGLFGFIPVVGIIITTFLAGAFLTLFYYRALGLLYADA